MTTPDPELVKAEIAREIARVHLDSYGEPAHDVHVVLHDRFVSVLMSVKLSRAEKTLLGAGRVEGVRAARETFQEVIAATFIAVVERATGRRVDGFASRTVIDPAAPWSAEIFRLAS